MFCVIQLGTWRIMKESEYSHHLQRVNQFVTLLLKGRSLTPPDKIITHSHTQTLLSDNLQSILPISSSSITQREPAIKLAIGLLCIRAINGDMSFPATSNPFTAVSLQMQLKIVPHCSPQQPWGEFEVAGGDCRDLVDVTVPSTFNREQ